MKFFILFGRAWCITKILKTLDLGCCSRNFGNQINVSLGNASLWKKI